jgi:hypothetical protein
VEDKGLVKPLEWHKHDCDTPDYIADAGNRKQAVIVDIETFNRMESIIGDPRIGKFMEETEDGEILFCP